MAVISATEYPDLSLIVLSLEGDIDVNEFLKTLRGFAAGEIKYRNVIWDTTQGSVGELDPSVIRDITDFLKKGLGMRQGGKTAVVAPEDLNYGIGRVLQAYTDLGDLLVEYRTFRSLEDAMAWMREE